MRFGSPFALLVALACVMLVAVPLVSADCTPQEAAYVGTSPDPTSVSYISCSGSDSWSYETPGADPPPETCQNVPVVRVLGQEVPGTGQTYCPPAVSGQSDSGTNPAPVLAVCYQAAGTTGCLGMLVWPGDPGCVVATAVGLAAGTLGGSGSCFCTPRCYYLLS